MPRVEHLEEQFRFLHKSTYQTFTETHRLARAERDHRLSFEKGREEQERSAIYRISQQSAEDYARIDHERQEALKEHVHKVRTQCIERQSKEAESAKRRAALGGFRSPNLISIPIYASSVLSDAMSNVENIPGERGNPWVLPWNPDKVKVSLSASSTQYGLCGLARVYQPPVIVDFWFAFLADSTGIWNFLALVDSFGFYLLNANRGFLLCRDSRVTFDASLNVYQYFWFGEKDFPILNAEYDSGFAYGFVEEYGNYDYQAFLRADSTNYVFLRVRMTVFVDAYGSGSWSEINFKDGEANYIKPLLLAASPIV